MKRVLCGFFGLALIFGWSSSKALAQTDGSAKMEVTINDYVGNTGTAHYTVAWVTTASGTFIKSLRRQGPSSWTSSQWANHCTTWNTARGGSTSIDGYTSATATTYTGTNSPVIQYWNCRDANNNLLPDGDYKFWVQYAEDATVQGPYTTSGLLWTKGPSASTNTYANQGANFTSMKITWTPATTAVAPTITSAAPTATATVGVPYSFTCTATGTTPITFTANGLPTGLTISTAGVISGTPTAGGTFSGTITAANGTLPNATQPFTVVVTAPPTITSAAPTATATVGVAYSFTCAATGTTPITFTASGLPTGLAISTAGIISGTPTAAGTFSGTITAANGIPPNATQAFSIVVSVVPAAIANVSLSGANLVMSGQGPANGSYSVQVSTDAGATGTGAWNSIATGRFDASGQFRFTNAASTSIPKQFYRLRVP